MREGAGELRVPSPVVKPRRAPLGNSYEERLGPRSHPHRAKARRVPGDLCSLVGHGQAWAAVVWEPWPGSSMPGVGNGSLQEGYQLLERTIN